MRGEVAPRDIIAWMLIKDLADHRLEIARYRRIRTALVRHPVDRRAEEMEEVANANYQQELLVLDETVHELRAKVEANGRTDVVQDYVKIDAYAAEQRDAADQLRQARSPKSARIIRPTATSQPAFHPGSADISSSIAACRPRRSASSQPCATSRVTSRGSGKPCAAST